jgi:hypothetical protein
MKLDRTGNAMDIQLINFPPISSPVETKAPAFNVFSDNLEAHLDISPFAEASAFITSHVPVSSGSALQETLNVNHLSQKQQRHLGKRKDSIRTLNPAQCPPFPPLCAASLAAPPTLSLRPFPAVSISPTINRHLTRYFPS